MVTATLCDMRVDFDTIESLLYIDNLWVAIRFGNIYILRLFYLVSTYIRILSRLCQRWSYIIRQIWSIITFIIFSIFLVILWRSWHMRFESLFSIYVLILGSIYLLLFLFTYIFRNFNNWIPFRIWWVNGLCIFRVSERFYVVFVCTTAWYINSVIFVLFFV